MRYALLLAALAITGTRLYGQGEPVVFRSDVSLVRVDAQVVDANNRTITGLTAGDFVLRDNGELQQIRDFGSENMPLDVMLLLDVSGSMKPHVERVAYASHQALQVLGGRDRVAVMVFDRESRVHLPFRENRSPVEQSLHLLLREETFNGGTDITRGMLDAATYVMRGARKDARRAVVIVTDDQTGGERNENAVAEALAEADAVMSALLAPDAMRNRPVSIPSWPGGQGSGWPGGGIWGSRGQRRVVYRQRTHSAGTAEIARMSGGDSMSVDDGAALENTLARLRQRYALHYYLPEAAKAGGPRDIQIELTAAARRRHPGAEVRFRRPGTGTQTNQEPVSQDGRPRLRRRPIDTTASSQSPKERVEIFRPDERTAAPDQTEQPERGWRRVDQADCGWRRPDEPVKGACRVEETR